MTPSQERAMDLFDDSHTHTARCWWDCDEARWVCASVDPAGPADDHGTGDLYVR